MTATDSGSAGGSANNGSFANRGHLSMTARVGLSHCLAGYGMRARWQEPVSGGELGIDWSGPYA